MLLAKEFSPLEPGVVENKWYALGVGVVKTATITGATEQIHVVAIKPHDLVAGSLTILMSGQS